jgi:hypothetical protein
MFRQTIIALLIIFGAAKAIANDAPVVSYGEFTNLHSSTGEHCSGYNVELWTYKDNLVGFLSNSEGLCGDSPTGVLEHIDYVPSTGALSFSVKISMGCSDLNEKRECIYSKDLFSFKGKLSQHRLKGTMTWYDPDTKRNFRSENITLKRSSDSSYMQRYESLERWEAAKREKLKRRGPRW